MGIGEISARLLSGLYRPGLQDPSWLRLPVVENAGRPDAPPAGVAPETAPLVRISVGQWAVPKSRHSVKTVIVSSVPLLTNWTRQVSVGLGLKGALETNRVPLSSPSNPPLSMMSPVSQ